jgi:hypothetical protein
MRSNPGRERKSPIEPAENDSKRKNTRESSSSKTNGNQTNLKLLTHALSFLWRTLSVYMTVCVQISVHIQRIFVAPVSHGSVEKDSGVDMAMLTTM